MPAPDWGTVQLAKPPVSDIVPTAFDTGCTEALLRDSIWLVKDICLLLAAESKAFEVDCSFSEEDDVMASRSAAVLSPADAWGLRQESESHADEATTRKQSLMWKTDESKSLASVAIRRVYLLLQKRTRGRKAAT